MDTRRLSRSNLSRWKEEENIHVHRITRVLVESEGDQTIERWRRGERGQERVGVDKNKRALFFNDREARPLKSCLLAECSRHCPNYSRIPREPLSLLLSFSLSLLLSILLFNLPQSLCRTSSRSPTRISCQLFLPSSSNRPGIKLLRTKGTNNPVQ